VKKKEHTSTEFIPPKQEVREAKRLNMKDLIGGNVLSREIVIRQIPFALFLFVMLLFYIANQYRGDKVMKEIVDTEKRLKELRTESVSTAFELMEKSKQTEVIRLIKENGLPLEEAMEPPITIEAK
jgi:cell division protein FtsL